MFEILIIGLFIYFFLMKKNSKPEKIYDINWNIINNKNRNWSTSIIWKIIKFIILVPIILLGIACWGCLLIALFNF